MRNAVSVSLLGTIFLWIFKWFYSDYRGALLKRYRIQVKQKE